MAWTDKIYSYCERGLNPDFWAEPVNALTNAAFIVAAILATRIYLRQPTNERRTTNAILIAIVFAIGVGSFLFHTFADRWSVIADMAPIVLFIFLYLFVALTWFLKLNSWQTLLVLIGFVVISGVMSTARCSDGLFLLDLAGQSTKPCLNGSASYVPPLVAMLIIGGLLRLRNHPAAGLLLSAGTVFTLSVIFRTVDQAWCDHTHISGEPLGTHFKWHVLNAITLYLLLKASLNYGNWSRTAV